MKRIISIWILLLCAGISKVQAQNDATLAGMILVYTNKAEKELKNQEKVMLMQTTGHVWTKEEVEGTTDLQREFNNYLNSFRSIVCYAAQIYGFYHEISQLTDNMGDFTKQLSRHSTGALAVALSTRRNQIFREMILNSVEIVNDTVTGKVSYHVNETGMEDSLVFNTLIVPKGGEYSLELPDGTVVWVNSESALRFPEKFTSNRREVFLEGEAYFEVTKDTTRSFIVEANGMEVKVYGTQFNVNTRRDDQIQTTLVEGSVSVKPKGLAEVMLKPNQQAVFNKLAGRVSVRDVDVMSYVAWQRGNYYFENKSIGEILDELSLWYDIQVFFVNNEVRNERFSGYLPRYEEIDRLLSLIEKTSHVQFEIKGRVIIVRK